MVRANITPDREHDLMGQIMLYLSLQPSQQVRMATHSYSFPDDSEVTFQMLIRERGRKYHLR